MGDQKTRQMRSPPADKARSLELDCREQYGENNKARRKIIPRFKAASNRSGRRGSNTAMGLYDPEDTDDFEASLSKADLKALKPFKRKVPDTPLKNIITRQMDRRRKSDDQ